MIRLILMNVPSNIDSVKLRSAARCAYRNSGFRFSGVVNVNFVTKSESRRLNSHYAHKNEPTDVLSFAYAGPKDEVGQKIAILGDIAICTTIAKRQAKNAKQSLQAEITLLLVHGLLHVFGLDHGSRASQTGFEQLQNAIIEELKLTPRQFFNDYS